REDYVSNVKTVAGNVVTLLGGPTVSTVVGKRLEQNFTRNGAAYITKPELAVLAKGMHEDAPDVRFNVTTQALKVTVDASSTTCQGSNSNCNSSAWNFGGAGTQTGSGKIVSYTYAAPAPYTITF